MYMVMSTCILYHTCFWHTIARKVDYFFGKQDYASEMGVTSTNTHYMVESYLALLNSCAVELGTKKDDKADSPQEGDGIASKLVPYQLASIYRYHVHKKDVWDGQYIADNLETVRGHYPSQVVHPLSVVYFSCYAHPLAMIYQVLKTSPELFPPP